MTIFLLKKIIKQIFTIKFFFFDKFLYFLYKNRVKFMIILITEVPIAPNEEYIIIILQYAKTYPIFHLKVKFSFSFKKLKYNNRDQFYLKKKK